MKDIMQLILMIIPIIVALINIIVNCIKDVKEVKNPKALVLVVALILCLLAAGGMIMYLGLSGWQPVTVAIIIAILGSFVMAHIAMYGYDKGYEDLIALIKNLVAYILGGGSITHD